MCVCLFTWSLDRLLSYSRFSLRHSLRCIVEKLERAAQRAVAGRRAHLDGVAGRLEDERSHTLLVAALMHEDKGVR